MEEKRKRKVEKVMKIWLPNIFSVLIFISAGNSKHYSKFFFLNKMWLARFGFINVCLFFCLESKIFLCLRFLNLLFSFHKSHYEMHTAHKHTEQLEFFFELDQKATSFFRYKICMWKTKWRAAQLCTNEWRKIYIYIYVSKMAAQSNI